MMNPVVNLYRGGKAGLRLRLAASITVIALATAACVTLPPSDVTPMATSSDLVAGDCVAPPPADPLMAQQPITETVVPSRASEGVPADATSEEQIIAAVWNMVNCWNSGESEVLIALLTPDLLQNQFGITDPEVAPFVLANLPPLAIDSLGDVRTHDEGVVSVDIVYRREVGQHMLVHERWFLQQRGESFLLDALSPLPIEVDGPLVEIEARVSEDVIELSHTTFAQGNALVFRVANDDVLPHEFAVFRIHEPATPEEIVSAGELPQGSDITGATFALPGEQATDLVLVGLEPGQYVVICNLEMPEGSSHLQRGEVAAFSVQAQ